MARVEVFDISFWYETSRRHVVLHQTPLSVADKFSQHMLDSKAAWIFTSATLAVDQGFDHFARQLGINLSQTASQAGLKPARQLLLVSPFDYQNQSQLLLPRYLPEANHPSRAQALTELALPLITASQGACFLLFTSYRMMNMVAELLAEVMVSSDELELEANTPAFSLLVQGQMGKRKLLNEFITQKNAVLLATQSFWEGVDVRGDKLTCVIIDKLPFASPDDPLLQARSEDVRRKQGDPFSEIQLPQAVITLKQGVGRLIRDSRDKGVLVICDDRLVNRPYGATFLKSLPEMKRTRELSQCLNFLESLQA